MSNKRKIQLERLLRKLRQIEPDSYKRERLIVLVKSRLGLDESGNNLVLAYWAETMGV
jgi:hypothetical protein